MGSSLQGPNEKSLDAEQERLKALEEYERLRTENALFFYKPYERQREFHAVGLEKRERLFMAGNQLGKTVSGGDESAMHATGIYPEWWTGKRFKKPIRAWVAGVTGESTRDNPQRILLGPTGALGTGAIPKSYIAKTSAARGIPDAIETVLVKHVSGGVSQITFKAYADGREKWQGESLDFVWFDEEPPMDIYTEGLTRTNATKGMVFITFTPLLGMSEVVCRFLNEKSEDRIVINMTIDDVGHYTEEEKRRIINAYPPHEREARSKGVPMLGSGRIFPIPEDWLREKTIAEPETWYRIIGIDLGWDHPTAAVKILATTNDIKTAEVHVVKAYRQSRESPLIHAAAIKPWGPWPVAWPHDALQHDKGSGEQLANIYKRHGLKMLSEHAQFPDDRGNGVEAGITEMLELMQQGRFKVDENLHEWFEEFRTYHRKDGKIVKEREDLISATRYGLTMLRYARPLMKEEESIRRRYGKPRLKWSGATWMSS